MKNEVVTVSDTALKIGEADKSASPIILVFIILLEVALQQAFQTAAMSCLVAGHLMDSVVDGIQAVLLCAGSQVELALSCAVLAVNAPCQVVLGGGLHVGLQILAQQFSELSSVLSLFKSCLLPVQANFGIALAVSNTGHAQVHTNLGALALEVGHQLLEDVLLERRKCRGCS